MANGSQLVRIDAIPAGATFVGADGSHEWLSLDAVRVESDGGFTLHVRHRDGGDGYRRWSADQASRELSLILA